MMLDEEQKENLEFSDSGVEEDSKIVIDPINETPVSEPLEQVAETEEAPITIENVSSVAETPEVSEEVKPESKDPSYDEIVVLLRQYFNALRDSIRLAKTKDDTIAKMKNELMKYREDFGYSLLKQAIMSLISYREDAKNTLRNVAKFSSDVETCKKYLNYLDDDFVESLSNLNITFENDQFFLNGEELNSIKPHKVLNYQVETEISDSAESTTAESAGDDNVTPCEEKPATLQDVIDLVNENKANIENILKDNALLDQNFKDVEAVAASIDQNYACAYQVPAYKKLTVFYTKLHKMIENTLNSINEENKTFLYSDILMFVISETSELLVQFGVEIDVDISNNYDMKTNRMLKFVPTDKPELDKTIAYRHTDTYYFNGKIIYFSKVDVYKYEQQ